MNLRRAKRVSGIPKGGPLNLDVYLIDLSWPKVTYDGLREPICLFLGLKI